jgi:DNA-binding protein H-NS
MSSPDISKLSYSELVALSKRLDNQISSKREEELKVLADGFVKKIEAAGFSITEAVEALQPYVVQGSKQRKGASVKAAVLFRDPANPNNTWSGRGRAAKWLADYESQGRSRNEFKV